MVMEGILIAVVSGLILEGVKSSKVTNNSELIQQYLEYTTDKEMKREEIHREILKKLDTSKKTFDQLYKSVQEDSHFVELISQNINYKTKFAMRLDYVMTLINAYPDFNENVNLEILAEYLGFDSVNILKKYYTSDKEPTFAFISSVAKKLGLNEEWLKNGKNKPFQVELKSHCAMGCIDEVIALKPEKIIFCLSEKSHMGIALKCSEFRYMYCNNTWHFNKNVGAGGMGRILSIYRFIKRLEAEKMLNKCDVRYLSDELFEKVFCGEAPASSAFSNGKRKFNPEI